jgi:hypothetical protein
MRTLLVDGVQQTQTMLTTFYLTGFVICYPNCPVIWCSKLQTEIALSTAKAEYIAMSHALHETIQIQNLIKEIYCIFALPNPMTDFCITLHEDNLSAIAMAESLKFTPRTKYIAIKYHHFCSRVNTSFNKSGDIKIDATATSSQGVYSPLIGQILQTYYSTLEYNSYIHRNSVQAKNRRQ